jgi:hypothetical protein
MTNAKVFGIGFHKTGTTSLEQALTALGYRVTGPDGVDDPHIAKNVHRMVDRLIQRYDAFQDNPWPVLYRYLDERCPGSKFILTLRPTAKWIASVVRHFGTDTTPMREWIYGVGSPRGNEDRYVRRYERHNEEVLAYFAGRPDDLLVLHLTEGEGWEKLCPFLGKPVPCHPFPHANEAGVRERSVVYRVARNLKRIRKLFW